MSINKIDKIFVISNHKIDPCGINKDEILSYSIFSLSWSFLIPSVQWPSGCWGQCQSEVYSSWQKMYSPEGSWDH